MADRRDQSGALNPLRSADRRWRAQLVACLFVAAATWIVGFAIEGAYLGWSDDAALARVEGEVRTRFRDMTASLQSTAAAVAGQRDLIQRTRSDPAAARELFNRINDVTTPRDNPDLAVTVYDVTALPIAWGGRPSELPSERIAGPSAVFVAPGPLGLRVVLVEPVMHPGERHLDGGGLHRIGTVVAERVLTERRMQDPTSENFLLSTSLATVALRLRYEGAGDKPDPSRFIIAAPSGEPLLDARVSSDNLAQARTQWRHDVRGVMLAILALALLLLASPLIDRRALTRNRRLYGMATLGVVSLIVAARAAVWLAAPARWTGPPLFSPSAYASASFGRLLRSPIDFLLTALTVLAIAVIALDAAERWRLGRRRDRQSAADRPGRFLTAQLAAGAYAAALFCAYELFLSDTVDNVTIDILHFSLHPWNPVRLALLLGLVLFHGAAVWLAVSGLLAGLARWRVCRSDARSAALAFAGWIAPLALVLVIAQARNWPLPGVQLVTLLATCGTGVWLSRRMRAWYRHATQAPRLLALFLALLIPTLLMYSSVLHYADRAKRRLIETQYAVQAAGHPQEMQVRLAEALRQIETLPLVDLVSVQPPAAATTPPTESAFEIWRRTDLAEFRLTSAVELYNLSGTLVSRFALNLPEYASTTQTWKGTECTWDVFGETAPFGSEERRMLHAERAICEPNGRKVGAVVIHVMLDYSTLPFISSQSPYFEFFRTNRTPVQEGAPGRDVEVVIYGWGRLPLYTSGGSTWPLDEPLFARIARSRQPFWTTLRREDGVEYHLYFLNDRAGIYAVGYPVLGVFDHSMAVAELANLTAVAYILLLAGSTLFAFVTRRQAPSGRVLFREIRQSFYRKLFLAFVAASVVPVLILAIVIRAYFTTLLRADVQAEAARTAAVAQRVIEEQVAFQQRGPESLSGVGDDDMVLVSKLIDQDVNIFVGPRLIATSERDLFASGLLPPRTPDEVYRAIVLQRVPRFVTEDAIGEFRYMLAAAPVHLGGREAILTVPMASRQQEIEKETDDLDRGVYLAALVFIVLGAGIGFWMAERIGDPVKRLTRATQRIAKGDFDAAVAVKSVDELQRLVRAFNSMAVELKRQRDRLERTHRLEAWADMARQVAHEIKNPLTPIQLSAEHLRRVHADRGAPLGPVLDGCVESILNQVRILRQISAEFSNFASSPTARPVRTSISELVNEVVDPYRAGLKGRVDILVRVPDDLPPVQIDRTLVVRALANLIENALHAMPGSGRLTIAGEQSGETVRVRVMDTGVGMDEAALSRIFEPYFSTKATGTGLGLTIAKKNIEATSGTIAVESERGKGTTVTVTLPVARREASESEGAIAARQAV